MFYVNGDVAWKIPKENAGQFDKIAVRTISVIFFILNFYSLRK